MQGGVNYFERLETRAAFDEGYSLEDMRRKIGNDEKGMSALTMDGEHQYVCWTPIGSTAWTLCVVMPSGSVDAQIEALSAFMSHSALSAVLVITAVILCLSLFYIRSLRASARLLKIEKTRAEDALEQAKKANLAKSDFLSTVSHDIRTPMNAIMGMTTLAVAHIDDKQRVADCLQKITLSSRHLLSLINDILDMSKIERVGITLHPAVLSMHDQIAQVFAIVDQQARENGLRFNLRIGEIRHEYVRGDPLRINQVLVNLLSNALKFTPEGGSVELLVEQQPSPRGADYARLRFTVRDSGIGMPEEFLAHVFEPFSRSRNVARVEGTGLGLSIAKGLVDLMGGAISVESRVNQGTTFRVELDCPVAGAPDAAGQDAPAAPARPDSLSGRRFLVAEDNAINAKILCSMLEMQGARTVLVTDGAKAVRAFRDAQPGAYDAILMDIQMPEMNGYDAARAIRETPAPPPGRSPSSP